MERRRSSSSVGGDGGDGNPLTGPITRDEVFNLLEEKADRKDLEKRMAAIVTRYGTTPNKHTWAFTGTLSDGLPCVVNSCTNLDTSTDTLTTNDSLLQVGP